MFVQSASSGFFRNQDSRPHRLQTQLPGVLFALLMIGWLWPATAGAQAPAGDPPAGEGVSDPAAAPAAVDGEPVTPLPPTAPAPAPAVVPALQRLDVWALLQAGGTIGWIIMVLSVVMVALLIEHAVSVRRGTLMPPGLAEEADRLIAAGQYAAVQQLCRQRPSLLSHVLAAGLAEVQLGYAAVEKAMEDASLQQASRLFRRLEYFTIIGTIAPMLGLLGTVWGMILAFMEFEVKANPQVSELAPGIYRALVTTLQGLCVAIPALAIYAVLRNRVEELMAQTALAAEQSFAHYKRATALRKLQARRSRGGRPPEEPA